MFLSTSTKKLEVLSAKTMPKICILTDFTIFLHFVQNFIVFSSPLSDFIFFLQNSHISIEGFC